MPKPWPSLLLALAPLVGSGPGCVGGAETVAPGGPAGAPAPTTVLAAAAGRPSLALDAAPLRFVDVTREAGLDHLQWQPPPTYADTRCAPQSLVSGGAAAGDYDGDGDADLFVTRLDAPDLLFDNGGGGRFREVGAAAGVDHGEGSNGAAWIDVDGDGDLDLFLTTLYEEGNLLFINDGGGRFGEEGRARGVSIYRPGEVDDLGCSSMFGVAAGDVDHDGDVDLHVTQWQPFVRGADGTRLLLNDGTGHFTDGTAGAGVEIPGSTAFTSELADLDGDGWVDLAVVADFGRSVLFRNRGDGTFEDVTEQAGVGTDENGMGSAIGDLDGDGDLDWFVTGIAGDNDGCRGLWGCSGNRLYRNGGGGRFEDATDLFGVRDGGWGWGAAIADLDGDSRADLVMTTGYAIPWDEPAFRRFQEHIADYGRDPIRLWVGGGAPMLDRAPEAGLLDDRTGRAILPFDYDGDGDLDLFVTNNGAGPTLYENAIDDPSRWLTVRVRSGGGNHFGLGARVELSDASGARQVRHLRSTGTYLGSLPAEARFGLGGATAPLTVEVLWPATGDRIVVADAQSGDTITVRVP